MKHLDLTLMARALGYTQITTEGCCRGFSSMWAQAVCLKDMGSFYKRYEALKSFSAKPSELAEKVAQAQDKVKNKTPLTEEDQTVLDINVFFSNIALYLYPSKATGFLGNTKIAQHEISKVGGFIQSDALKEKGGFLSNLHTVETYDHEQLVAHLDRLHEAMEGRPDAAILLDSGDHSIALQILPDKKFRVIDTNSMNFIDEQSAFSSQITANIVPSALFHGQEDKLIMSTAILTAANNPVDTKDLQSNTTIDAIYMDSNNDSVLDLAARWNCVDVLKRIDFNKIDINTLHRLNMTALHNACKYGNVEAAAFLLEQKPDLQIRDNSGLTALHCACVSGKKEIAELLLSSNQITDINQLDRQQRTPFYVAVQNDNKELCEFLICKDADFKRKNILENGPFDCACENGNKDIAELLLNLDPSIDVNKKPPYDDYPLVRAINSGSYDLVKLLLERGADLNIKDKNGKTMSDLAKTNDHEGIIALVETNLVMDVTDNADNSNAFKQALKKTLNEIEDSENVELDVTHINKKGL